MQDTNESILDFIKSKELSHDNTKKIEYTKKHIVALKTLQSVIFSDDQLLSERLNKHDKDKIDMLELGIHPKDASMIHRFTQSHHPESPFFDTSETGIKEFILDFESAQYTKPDKPLNAHDTIMTYYPHLYDIAKPYLQSCDIDYSYVASDKFPELHKKILDNINRDTKNP